MLKNLVPRSPFQVRPDGSILVSGSPSGGIYEIQYTGNFSNVTGIRLEAIKDASSGLPQGGPGFYPTNGAFTLSEFEVFAAGPEEDWELIPGNALDIGAGGGAVWVIGTNNAVYRYNGQGGWQRIPNAVSHQVSVDDAGSPWVVHSNHNIYKFDGSTFTHVPGQGRDGGAVWVIGSRGRTIHRYNGEGENSWDTIEPGQPGTEGIVHVAVDNTGNAWVITDGTRIYRYTGSNFTLIPGRARDIGAGGGEVWVISTDGHIYRYSGQGASPWTRFLGVTGSKRIEVDDAGNAWVTAQGDKIYRYAPPQ